jgi:large subunit ribosomal protein L22
MDVQAINKYNRISAAKVAEVTREIQGLSVSRALDTLRFIPRKAARMVEKTLKSALANATNNADLRAETLVVKIAAAEKGPVFKRFKASARGMASPRLRRTSHIRIVLSDEGEMRSQRAAGQRGVTKAAASEPATEPKPKAATTE